MKYLVYNLPGDKAVKLEAYIDSVSEGDVSKGIIWKKVGEMVDDGNWPAPSGDCGYPDNTVITMGGGVVFIRHTNVAKAQYKMLSWREIAPNEIVGIANSGSQDLGSSQQNNGTSSYISTYNNVNGSIVISINNTQKTPVDHIGIYDVCGNLVKKLQYENNNNLALWNGTNMNGGFVGSGVYIIVARVNSKMVYTSIILTSTTK
jgi:hypothetical protein